MTDSGLPVVSFRGITAGSVCAWISKSGSEGESGILRNIRKNKLLSWKINTPDIEEKQAIIPLP